MPKHLFFFSLMAIASAIGVAKSAVLAAVLPPLDFSYYAAVFALTGILSSFVSFGLTEGMVKKFVRLIAFRRNVELRTNLSASVRQLTRRYILILLLAGAGALTWQRAHFLPTIAAILIAYAVSCFSIASSVLEAMDIW
ncbi:hypothetical protein ACFIOY_35070 [Bradyrhizobium sp. TZ2]